MSCIHNESEITIYRVSSGKKFDGGIDRYMTI